MSGHLITDDTATATVVDPAAAPGWWALSAAMTDQVVDVADREDLIVTIAPGAGHGAPACFFPARAIIEIDGLHLGTLDPATARPHRIADRARYATAWGLLVHECAHVRHSHWSAPSGTPPGALEAATLLEESRIEVAQIRRRPDDRHWLRAASTRLILHDLLTTTGAGAMTRQEAAQAAGLVLARTDGGIFTPAETAPLARIVADVLGSGLLAELREVWRQARIVADTDATGMIELGYRWCTLVGIEPDAPTTAPDNPMLGPSRPSAITTAIAEVLATVATAVTALAPSPGGRAPHEHCHRRRGRTGERRAGRQHRVHPHRTPPPERSSTHPGHRHPHPHDRRAHRRPHPGPRTEHSRHPRPGGHPRHLGRPTGTTAHARRAGRRRPTRDRSDPDCRAVHPHHPHDYPRTAAAGGHRL
ncbi:hypothetical protein [Allokutzneria oryzae]|uniref:Uncharacterized protein n=1 Tax=Allokutzneria oryzae TaxID=1378989 RepID=A0ABV5ZRQ6_9PSEU